MTYDSSPILSFAALAAMIGAGFGVASIPRRRLRILLMFGWLALPLLLGLAVYGWSALSGLDDGNRYGATMAMGLALFATPIWHSGP